MAVEERVIRCSCGREYNAARLERCPACRRLPSEASAEVTGPVEPSGIPAARVTTLSTLAGYSVVRSLGVVTSLSANSGWTATSKGNNALDQALTGLRKTASEMGANAILGLSGGPFGAHGGLTAGFGGDAVGILLLGTAVRVVHDPEPSLGAAIGALRVPPGLRLEALQLAIEADPSLSADDAETLDRLAVTIETLESQLRLRFERNAVLAEVSRRESERVSRQAVEEQAQAKEMARLAAEVERQVAQTERAETGERVLILGAADKQHLAGAQPGATEARWLPDPLREGRERFWNGAEWTGRVRNAQT